MDHRRQPLISIQYRLMGSHADGYRSISRPHIALVTLSGRKSGIDDIKIVPQVRISFSLGSLLELCLRVSFVYQHSRQACLAIYAISRIIVKYSTVHLINFALSPFSNFIV